MIKLYSYMAFVSSLFVFVKLIGSAPLEVTTIICSYNNEAFCERNFLSVAMQSYPYHTIIYIDDCSTDKTQEKIINLIKNYNINNKVKFIHNKKRKGALRNIYETIHTLPDSRLVVLVDGDDWLYHERVLDRVIREYANPQIWITYGQFKRYSNNSIGICKPFPHVIMLKNIFRQYPFVSSHLKTFKAKLFKQINPKDLREKYSFYGAASDVAFMIPMLEMASQFHIAFIPEILYIYNDINVINDHKIKQKEVLRIENRIRKLPSYKSLKSLAE